MKKIALVLILGILLVGILAFGVYANQGNGNNKISCTSEQDCINASECSAGLECTCYNNKCYTGLVGVDDECDTALDCENKYGNASGVFYICDDGKCIVGSQSCGANCTEDNNKTEIKANKTKVTFVPWQKRNESECLQGCSCHGAVMSCLTETGKIMTIEAGRSGNIITITVIKNGNISVNTTLELEQETNETTNKTKLKAKLSNGRKAEVKIMPDTASERAIERLGQLNFTIQLKEVGKGNETGAAYELQAERHMRILGLFKAKAQVKAQVDAETGEIIAVKKPWWAFLATEPKE